MVYCSIALCMVGVAELPSTITLLSHTFLPVLQCWSNCVSITLRNQCVPFWALFMYSASPHLSKRVKPADYLAMWCVDIVGLCFPEFWNPWKSFTTATYVVVGRCNTKGDMNANFLLEALTGASTLLFIFVYVIHVSKSTLLEVNHWVILTQQTSKRIHLRRLSYSWR